MNTLSKQHCVPCSAGTPPLTNEQARTRLAELRQGWQLAGSTLMKTYTLADFRTAIAFVDQVAEIAETEGHHPNMTIAYNRVTCELWTHKINGLSENDFILAAKIESLAQRTS